MTSASPDITVMVCDTAIRVDMATHTVITIIIRGITGDMAIRKRGKDIILKNSILQAI